MEEMKYGCLSLVRNTGKSTGKGPDFLTTEATAAAHRLHRELEVYEETPLARLNAMAARLGVKAVAVKDESKRFGLNAFKGLGGIYALSRVVCGKLGLDIETTCFTDFLRPEYREIIKDMVFISTTDGNHGKGVAWAAGQLGCRTHIFMPVGSTELRAQAIRDVNPRAEVTIMDVGYDDAVRCSAALAEKNGWYLVQDTSWEGYSEVPTWIIQGYTTMAEEAFLSLEAQGLTPTHVFLQAGVGAMAGGVLGYLANRYEGRRPKFIVTEPETMACIYESARRDDGNAHPAVDQGPTIMAGLNCGEPCLVTWPILRDFADWYVKCPDFVTKYGMRLLAAPENGDPQVVSGESGAVTTGLVNLIAGRPEYEEVRNLFGIDGNSVILCFSTEGNTDPELYRKFVYEEGIL